MDETPIEPNESPETPAPHIDQLKLQMFMQRLRDEQNFGAGAAAGLVAAALGAALWAGVTALSGRQFGIIAVAIGYAVGWAVRRFGKGLDKSYGVLGAILALVGCVAGKALAICVGMAQQEGMEFFEFVSHLDYETVGEYLSATFSPVDLLIYGVAVYEGYSLSIRRITDEEMAKLRR